MTARIGHQALVRCGSEGGFDSRARGIGEAHADELCACFAPFVEDWDSPEMAIDDDYDAAKARVKTRCCDPRAVLRLWYTYRQTAAGSCCLS
jgi:hypothetical protein